MHLALINQLSYSFMREDASARESAAQDLAEESQRFHEVFDHLLAMCARDYIMLSPQCQLNYLLLVAHYNLGSLILADTLDTVDTTPEPLQHPSFSRLHACQAIVNALSLSLNSDRYTSPSITSSSSPSYTQHMLLMDPSPELMVEVLLRTGNALLHLHSGTTMSNTTTTTTTQPHVQAHLQQQQQQLTSHATQAMFSVLLSALDILSRVSRNAGLARAVFRAATQARGLRVVIDGTNSSHEHRGGRGAAAAAADERAAMLAACSVETVEEFAQEMEIQAAVNPRYLDEIVLGLERKLVDG